MARPARPARRVLLGTQNAFARRQRVYRIPDGLEVEDIVSFTITCRRIFFDEVLLVTYHRHVGWPFLLTSAAAATWFGLVALGIGAAGGWLAGLTAFSVAVLPLLVAFVLRLVLRLDVITVYSKRTRAQLQFWFRKRRARELFQLICRLARERQERVASELAAEAPPALPAGEPPSS